MALGGGGLAQGGTGLVWARLAAPRMGLVGRASARPRMGLVGRRSDGHRARWAWKRRSAAPTRPPPCASPLAPLPPKPQVSPQFEPFPSSFLPGQLGPKLFSHNPDMVNNYFQQIVAVQTLCKQSDENSFVVRSLIQNLWPRKTRLTQSGFFS